MRFAADELETGNKWLIVGVPKFERIHAVAARLRRTMDATGQLTLYSDKQVVPDTVDQWDSQVCSGERREVSWLAMHNEAELGKRRQINAPMTSRDYFYLQEIADDRRCSVAEVLRSIVGDFLRDASDGGAP